MIKQELDHFFVVFDREFRTRKKGVFETFMFLALAHFFGFYNPKELADFLGIPGQRFYNELKKFSLYHLKQILLKFMVKQAAEYLKPVLEKSGPTISRNGITLSIDNSVIDRFGRMLRSTYSWHSGRFKKTVNGSDLLGVVLTISGIVIPLHLLFVSKQGRGNTDKPTLLISMMSALKEEFIKHDIDITMFSLTMDSWFVSEKLRQELYSIGFRKIVLAGKGNYVFRIKNKKQKARLWKKEIELSPPKWGIDVPSYRVKAESPTFKSVVVFFFKKSTTRVFYLIDFSENHMRGAEIWHIWKQHYLIEHFWRILKSVFKIRAMRLQGDGIYTGLLIKVFAYLLAIRIKSHKLYSKLSVVQIMRKLRRELDLRTLLNEHFHLPFSVA